jgi:hypothetical protein
MNSTDTKNHPVRFACGTLSGDLGNASLSAKPTVGKPQSVSPTDSSPVVAREARHHWEYPAKPREARLGRILEGDVLGTQSYNTLTASMNPAIA